MTKYLLILLLLAFSINHAQVHKSIHQLDSERYSSVTADKNNLVLNKETSIIPLNKSSVSALNKAVFGFLPDWEYSTAKNYLRYDLLTHIAAFDFVVSSNGAITNPSGWPWTDVINAAHAKGVKVIMTAVNFTDTDITNLLTNASAKNNFFNNTKNIILNYNLDGVNVDFEGLATADRGAPINTFMQELTNYLHSAIPGCEVSFAGPAINWSGWDLVGLANACDYIFIMGYDFYGSWSTTSGPSAPLGGTGNTVLTTLTSSTKGYASVIASMPEKLILGVPYYGNKWTTKTSAALSEKISFKGSTRFKDDAVNVGTYGRIWESTYQVPWYRYQIGSEWYQVWYDDQQSLGIKYDMAISKGLKGIGMWALGYDGTRSELWDLISQKFNIVVPVELVSFNASVTGSLVELSWKTATELNNSGFEIERKLDAGEFIKIAFVSGHGTSSELHNYLYQDNIINMGGETIEYRLKQIDSDGTYNYSEIVRVELSPDKFDLSQNYPNPFNPSTLINYQIPSDGFVTIKVFDVLGNEAGTLVNGWHSAGQYLAEISAEGLSGGTYFYTLTSGGYTITRKMLILK